MLPKGDGPAVRMEHLVKKFGDFVAVNDVSLDVAQGEIFGWKDVNLRLVSVWGK